MELLPRDVLLMIAIEDMDYLSIIHLCKTNTRYNTILCNNPLLWRRKLQRDYPNLNLELVEDYKGLYIHLKKAERSPRHYGLLKRLTQYLKIKGIYGIRMPDLSFKIVDNQGEVRSCVVFPSEKLIDMLKQLTGTDIYSTRTHLCRELELLLESMNRIVDLST